MSQYLQSIPQRVKTKAIQLVDFLRSFILIWTWQTITFSGLLLTYLSYKLLHYIFTGKYTPKKISAACDPKITALYKKIVLFSTHQERTINRVSLIDLAIKNMLFKRSRAMITVGGMAIGIGAIVFLVSLGFGLQEMVISRVARLDELKQADVTTQPGSREVINDGTMAKIQELGSAKQLLPMISIVARVEYQSSVSDMAVYGVTSDYLLQSAIQPSSGELFTSNELSSIFESGKVAGATTSIQEYQDGDYALDPEIELPIEFSIEPNKWIKVRSSTSSGSTLVGYTRRDVGKKQGLRVWGNMYPESGEMNLLHEGKTYAPWIKADFPIWFEQECTVDSQGCVDGKYLEAKDSNGSQSIVNGYTALTNVILSTTLAPSDPVGQVLGVSTILAQADTEGIDSIENAAESEDSAEIDSSPVIDDSGDGWVEIASESAAATTEEVTTVSLGAGAKKVAVVNRAMLQILGLLESEALGKTFQATFIVVGDLLDKPGQKVESTPETYTIVAVVPEEKTPFFYVPFVDLRLMGINQYSQLKLVTEEAEMLPQARKQVEALGFATRSVADTVKQIDRLFATARVLLAVLGFVALSIAALGMFNTLTVSLLERTREVGLMKAMGMRSNEVRELFLTESLVMGFFGGILGIALGMLAGEALGLILSMFSVSKGVGYIDISYLPLSFVIFVFVLSLAVGVFTGIYPARRATKISALDALRYE